MKKIFIIILSCLFIMLILSFVKINIIKGENANVMKQIKNLKKDNEVIDNEIFDTQKQIEELKEVNKDKWQELNAWQKSKAKIQEAF